MDELTEMRAKYPNMSELHFIGHSHGTYVMASALREYKALHLRRAVFAGSVVPQDFDWASPALAHRIEGISNYAASSDLVVAWLPRLFEIFGGELGSAGFNGFRRPSGMTEDAWADFMKQFKWVDGYHSAAIQAGDTSTIASIADFVMRGGADGVPSNLAERQVWWVRVGSQWWGCLLIWLLMISIVAFAGLYVTWVLRRSVRRLAYIGIAVDRQKFPTGIVVWTIYIVAIWQLLTLI